MRRGAGKGKEHRVLSAPFPAMFAVSREHRIQPDAQCGGLEWSAR